MEANRQMSQQNDNNNGNDIEERPENPNSETDQEPDIDIIAPEFDISTEGYDPKSIKKDEEKE